MNRLLLHSNQLSLMATTTTTTTTSLERNHHFSLATSNQRRTITIMTRQSPVRHFHPIRPSPQHQPHSHAKHHQQFSFNHLPHFPHFQAALPTHRSSVYEGSQIMMVWMLKVIDWIGNANLTPIHPNLPTALTPIKTRTTSTVMMLWLRCLLFLLLHGLGLELV